MLGVEPDGLAERLTADIRPDQEMLDAVRRFHDAGIKTALVSNSWRESDYDVDDLFDAIVLSGRLGIRKPDPRIYRHAARPAWPSHRRAASSSTTSAGTSNRRKPWV